MLCTFHAAEKKIIVDYSKHDKNENDSTTPCTLK